MTNAEKPVKPAGMAEKTTYLITGGAGFIGSCFVRLCAERGIKAVVLDALTYAGHTQNLQGIEGDVELVVGDIRNRALVNELLRQHQPQALVHFAAESHVDNSIAAPGAFIDTNINGTYTLLEAAREYWKSHSAFRYVQISTDEVFGALGDTGYFTEQSPYAPNSPYSASKAAADQLVRAWHHTYGLPTIITHCSNNYGPRQLPEKLIPVIITSALKDKKLPVYGDGKHVRDWIHVEDHCQGILLALQNGTPGEHYCFGGRAEKQNIDLVTSICQLLDQLRPRANGEAYSRLIQFVPDRLGHDRRYAIDDSYAEQKLGFTRAYDFNRGLRATVEWYLGNAQWVKAVGGQLK